MPHYDYACSSCGYVEEIFQKITDKPLQTCPKCKNSSFQRQIGGGSALHFKGNGFYITDYKDGCGCGKSHCSDKE